MELDRCQRVAQRGTRGVGRSLWTSDGEARVKPLSPTGPGAAIAVSRPAGSSDRTHVTPSHPGVLLDSPGTGGTAGLVGEQGLGPSLLLRAFGVLDSVRRWVNVTNTTPTEPSWALRAQRQPRPAGTEPRPPTHQRCPEPGAHSPAPSGRNRPPQHCAQRRERKSVHTDFIPKCFSFRKIELISHESSCFI